MLIGCSLVIVWGGYNFSLLAASEKPPAPERRDYRCGLTEAVDPGNGLKVLYRLARPIDVASDPESINDVEPHNQALAKGKGAIRWTRLSYRSFAANAVRLQLHALG